jgi:pimeloyl-ACP methyl ester carboxylesterase
MLQQAQPDYMNGRNRWDGSQKTLRAIELTEPDMSSTTAIVVPHPYATGYLPHMAARMAMIQAGAPEPTRLIAFPNSTIKEPAMDLTRKERQKIAHGDFTPYGERALRTLEGMNIEKIHVVGYSQGAATGAHIMALAKDKGVLAVGDGLIAEAPNLQAQSFPGLMARFARVGMSAVYDAMAAAEVPMLRQSLDGAPASEGLRNMLSRDNLTLGRGMAHHAIEPDLFAAMADKARPNLTLMRAGQSNITPHDQLELLAGRLQDHFYDSVKFLEIPYAGHGVGDNVAVHGAMAAFALESM